MKIGKYNKVILGEAVSEGTTPTDVMVRSVVDVYAVLKAFGVTCPATQHAIKKLLMPGQRGGKNTKTDLMEALSSIERAIEIAEGDHAVEIEEQKKRNK